MSETALDQQRPDLGRLGYNFSIVGCQKSGTTTLAWAISKHKFVCRPPKKEAHFFNDESYDWDNPDYERDYTAPKRARIHRMVGDSTPVYIMWPGALERMHAYKPDMPLIAVFRDPLERLFSHWVMLRARNPKWPDWPDFITEFRPDSLPDSLPTGIRFKRYKHLAGVARGYYGAQLERGFEIFPREQWLLLEFREMLGDFHTALDRSVQHLGLPAFKQPPPLANRFAGAERITGTAPTGEDLDALARLYAADLQVFERLSGLDTSGWPVRRILEGTLDPEELAAKFAARVSPLEQA